MENGIRYILNKGAKMEKTEFKKVLGNSLKKFGFEYNKKAFYYSNDELIVVISTQKSNFDNSFYINYGFLIKDLTPEMNFPKENVCDVRGRFGFNVNDKVVYDFNFEKSTVVQLEDAIVEGVNTIILPVLNEGLAKYYEIFPEAITMATLRTKQYIGID